MYPVDNSSGLGSGPIKQVLGTGIPSSKINSNSTKFFWKIFCG